MTAAGSRIGLLLLAFALLLGAAPEAHAAPCSDYGGVLDGFAGDVPPARLQIDMDCSILNYPASNPFTSNISFFTNPGGEDNQFLVIFNNVVHTGQMSCNNNDVQNHLIWFTNGSSTSIKDKCQDLLIPVEKIDKQTPAGQTTAAIGVPFTYSLIIPVLFDPATGVVINSAGSDNELHSVIVTDDLNETGVDLTYLGHVAYWRDDGTPVSHTFSNVGGLLTFEIDPTIPIGDQIIVEITVVLEDTPTNAPGTEFVNTAKWEFGRLIDDVFYQPLPGEWGISPPLIIAAPDLVVTKTGPATLGLTLNLGQYGQFTVDVQNNGLTDAWDVTILDQLPDGGTGGMCDTTPEVLSAQVFEADGTTPVSGPLVPGTDFSVSYSGAPTCQLTLTMLTPAAAIGPTERLIITYQTKLDPDTQDGAMLTNVVGATEWFNGDSSNPDRLAFVRTLTDGTVGIDDHEDAHTVTAALFGYFFEKSVENRTTMVNPTATAAPGDVLRYTLRLQTTDVALTDLTITDDLGALNASAVFLPDSLTIVNAPGSAITTNTDGTGGSNGDGYLEVSNLDVPANSEILVQFDITVDPTIADGTIILNQSDLLSSGSDIADSDDPNINGQADPSVAGDEDPTRVVIQTVPPVAVLKENTQTTATIGESFSYQITVPETSNPYPMYDVRILDDLTTSGANLRFLSVTKISPGGSWTPVNTGSDTNLVIEDTAIGIDIPADEQIVIEITVVLEDTGLNAAGVTFANTADYTFNRIDEDDASQLPGNPGTAPSMTIVEPDLTLEKDGPAQMTIGTPATFSFDVQNIGDSPAWFATITDQLPDGATGGMCDVAPSAVTAEVFESDGLTTVSGPLVEDTDFSVTFSGAPTCEMTLTILSAAGTIGPGQRLLVSYETQLDANTQDGVPLTNIAGATEWFSTDGLDPDTAGDRRTYTRTLTNGTVGVPDHEDAHTVAGAIPGYLFEKTVINETTGADPALTATPGDVLRYRLRVENQGTEPLTDLTFFDDLDRLNDPAAFQPTTLVLDIYPLTADITNTSDTGGSKGTGLVDVRGLSVDPGESVVVEFLITLAPVIANGTLVTDQSQLLIDGQPFADSDDPNVNGPADPLDPDDEDPTQVLIQSAPAFLVEKVSEDLTGDPNILLAGDTLRYTITVKNVGTDNAVDAEIRDQIPVNTTYVPGSTTLNGTPVPDAPSGAPLPNGILIHAPPPEDPTPGVMRADASPTAGNVATIVFDVVVDPGVPDGTVISNQGFVSAPAGGVSDQPSDDPGTPIADDPTRDVVGSTPLLFAAKSVVLAPGMDGGTPGIVDPDDVLHYTITVFNTGAVAATGVVLTDTVPANTSYESGSTTLNTFSVTDPGGFPLDTGLPISSSDLTLPLPGPGGGTLTPGEIATIEFDLRVDLAATPGTIISNQAVVGTAELPDLLTDGDGNPATGPEPTIVVVGDGQQLSITKDVSVVGGGAALPGSVLEYVVRVVNVSAVPAFTVEITDDLDLPTAGQLAYVDPSATMNGSATGITVMGSLITADYFGTYGPLQPGESVVLRFRAVLDAGLAIGTTVINTAEVTWNDGNQDASASVSLDVGGMPGVGVLNGAAWHDADFDDLRGGTELALAGWIVELYRNGQLFQSTATDATGAYSIGGLPPNDVNGDEYELRFRAPDATANSASLGFTASAFTNGPQQISDIIVESGDNLQDLNLPIDPNGVVYDAIQRTPIAGATLTLLSGGVLVPPACFEDPLQQGQVTRADGYYKFGLLFDPLCPGDGDYVIAVAPPGSAYEAGYSQLIPPISGPSTSPFLVPGCPLSPDDAVPTTVDYCEVQPSPLAPDDTVPARTAGTNHYVHLSLTDDQVPGSSQIFNNHIPVDPVLDDAVTITKTTPSLYVNRGQLVPYEITIRNELGADLTDVSIVDRFPPGFRYVEGSARFDGEPLEPTIDGQELVWSGLGVADSESQSLRLLLAVGAGVGEGKFVNRAQAVSSLTAAALSEEATATVRVVPDPTFSCTDVMGKVFDDANRNGMQDPGEPGLPGVRLVTARGLAATTDPHGRYHITCAVTPNEARGSNFVLKLDDRTLPSGYRMSTRKLQVQRATAGKALRFNYAASIHRVVSLDLADAAFEPGSTEIRPQWRPRLDLLLEELEKAPSTLRLSYVADVEDEDLVEERLEAVQAQITEAWEARDRYELTIEADVFWRRGGPPERPDAGTGGRR